MTPPTIFDAASIQNAVQTALRASAIPPDHRHAFVLVATTRGAKAILSTRLGAHWTIDAIVAADVDATLEGGLSVKASW